MATEQRTATSYPVSYTVSGSISGTRYQNAIGKGADTDAVSGNDYASNNTAYIEYAFSFDIPETATIDSVECTVKGHYESSSSSSEQADLQLYAGSTAKGSVSSFSSTSAQVLTLDTGTWTRDEIDSMVLRFTIGYYGGLVNGATVTVTYSFEATYYTVTPTLIGDGEIDPSTSSSVLENYPYTVRITPTDLDATVTVTNNGNNDNNNLTSYYTRSTTSAVLGEYTLISGSFNSGESWFSGRTGNGYDTTDTTSSSYYSSSSGSIVTFQYAFSIDIPSNAIITNLYFMATGHAESTSNSNEYMTVQLKSGDTAFTEVYNFKNAGSTSSNTQTINSTNLPTVEQLSSLVLECTLGYYGGAIDGATVFVEYYVLPAELKYYEYNCTITNNTEIIITIVDSSSNKFYIKDNGNWIQVLKAYTKVNGTWTRQTDLTTIFDPSQNYKKGTL